MNKKAFVWSQKIGTVLVLLVFLAVIIGIFFRNDEGLFNKATEAAEAKFKEFIPKHDSSEPKSELSTEKEIALSFDSLYDAFSQGAKTDKTNCIIYYKEIPELNTWSLRFIKAEDSMAMRITNPEKQVTETKSLLNLAPCIVAGKQEDRNAAQNFFHNNIKLKKWIFRSIPLTGDQKEYTEHQNLETKEWKSGSQEYLHIDEKKYDLDDNNLEYLGEQISLLYKADANHICFIPTNERSNYNENGIDDHFLAEFLPVGKYPIPFCYQ